jgi:hypothetical protein
MDFTYKAPSIDELKFSSDTEAALKKDPKLGREMALIAKGLHGLRASTRAKQSKLLDYYTDRESGYVEGTAAWMDKSRKALEDSSTPAGLVIIAARNILGPGFAAWEPDTVRATFEQEKVELPAVNYEKLFAAATLLEVPAFYIEVLTFQNTVQAFNGHVPDVEVVHESTPGEIAWAVFEAEIILHEHMMYTPDFDQEPEVYTAAVLHRAGFVLAPPLLGFAQAHLTKLNSKVGPTVEEVRTAWEKLLKEPSLTARTYSEDPLDVQLAKLAAVHVYLADHAESYAKAMAGLSGDQ